MPRLVLRWKHAIARQSRHPHLAVSSFVVNGGNGDDAMGWFLSFMFALWLAAVGVLITYEPGKAWLMWLCMKYTFLGFVRMAGLY
jgi:hypothetical protein